MFNKLFKKNNAGDMEFELVKMIVKDLKISEFKVTFLHEQPKDSTEIWYTHKDIYAFTNKEAVDGIHEVTIMCYKLPRFSKEEEIKALICHELRHVWQLKSDYKLDDASVEYADKKEEKDADTFAKFYMAAKYSPKRSLLIRLLHGKW